MNTQDRRFQQMWAPRLYGKLTASFEDRVRRDACNDNDKSGEGGRKTHNGYNLVRECYKRYTVRLCFYSAILARGAGASKAPSC